MEKGDILEPGDICTVNGIGDLAIDGDAKGFIGRRCVFNRICRSGLYEVTLESNPKRKISLPKRNISVLGDEE